MAGQYIREPSAAEHSSLHAPSLVHACMQEGAAHPSNRCASGAHRPQPIDTTLLDNNNNGSEAWSKDDLTTPTDAIITHPPATPSAPVKLVKPHPDSYLSPSDENNNNNSYNDGCESSQTLCDPQELESPTRTITHQLARAECKQDLSFSGSHTTSGTPPAQTGSGTVEEAEGGEEQEEEGGEGEHTMTLEEAAVQGWWIDADGADKATALPEEFR